MGETIKVDYSEDCVEAHILSSSIDTLKLFDKASGKFLKDPSKITSAFVSRFDDQILSSVKERRLDDKFFRTQFKNKCKVITKELTKHSIRSWQP